MVPANITAAAAVIATCPDHASGASTIAGSAGIACAYPGAARETGAGPATGNAYMTAAATSATTASASTATAALSISGHPDQQ